MKISLLHPKELRIREIEAWHAIQDADARFDSPFLSPEFAIAVGDVRDDARVAMIEESNEIQGFLAFQMAGRRVGTAIGTGVSDVQALVHTRHFAWDAQDVVRRCGLQVFEFDHLIAEQMPFARNITGCESGSIMNLSGGYDAYMEEYGRSSRRMVKSAMQKYRKLEREHGKIIVDFDTRDSKAFNELLSWKSEQYVSTGRQDRFAVPWIKALVDNLYETKSEHLSGIYTTMHVGDDHIASHFGIRSRKTMQLWFPAYDTDYGKYSPGLLLFFEMARLAPESGVVTLDLGKGDEEYKKSLRSGEAWVAEGSIALRTPRAFARRAKRAPKRHVENFVLARPALRRGAREALCQVGNMRQKIENVKRMRHQKDSWTERPGA